MIKCTIIGLYRLTISQMTNVRLFQTHLEFTDNNFKFDENGKKLSKWIENAVGK